MLKVYGSKMCPDCVACKAEFDQHNIPYIFVDINESLRNLKDFLALRDSAAVFTAVKAAGGIGIPACVTEDGTVFTDWEEFLKEKGIEAEKAPSGNACSLDHKGC